MTDALVSERIKVPAVVDQGQVDFYVDNGYLAVPDLLSAGELDELKRDIIKLARGRVSQSDDPAGCGRA